jgi:uncharacterized repeat protein (TIGR01451 family)
MAFKHTTTSITADSATNWASHPVTFTATVVKDTTEPATATGTVAFYAGAPFDVAHELGTATVDSSGHAVLSVSMNSGSYTVTAVYSGDNLYNTSTSTSLPHSVVNPAIDISKTPDEQLVISGGTVTFTIAVTNTGDVTLTAVAVSDPLVATCDQNIGSLAPNAVSTYTCAQTGVNGSFTNTASVVGTPPVGPNVTDSDTAHVTLIGPGIAIAKTPDMQKIHKGESVSFTIFVTNTGDSPLTAVTVSDLLTPGCDHTFGTLNAGEAHSYTCALTNVTANFTNLATVTGAPPVGPNVTASDTAEVVVGFYQTFLPLVVK